MKLNFITSKSNNLFFFVSELAKEKRKSKLNITERKFLRVFSKIIFRSSNGLPLDLVFLTNPENRKWIEFEKKMSTDEIKEIKSVLKFFSNKFEKDWPIMKKELNKVQKYFNAHKNIFKKIITPIFELCDLKKIETESIFIHQIFNLKDTGNLSAWASWTPKRQDIVLEWNYKSVKQINKFDICVVAHEFFHLLIKKNRRLIDLIKTKADANRELLLKIGYGVPNPKHILEELILSSFIPEGYLAKKYADLAIKKMKPNFKKTNNLISFSENRKICAYLMKDIAFQYINEKRPIDENYINNLIEKIKQH